MNLRENKVLITGGATGIGYELTKMFLSAGSRVVVCGRRLTLMEQLRQQYPNVDYLVADISQESERLRLIDWIKNAHPDVNVLVNNAGVQERMSVSEADFWERATREIDLNLKGPVHLCSALLPVIRLNPNPVIINVSSGLAFAPMSKALSPSSSPSCGGGMA